MSIGSVTQLVSSPHIVPLDIGRTSPSVQSNIFRTKGKRNGRSAGWTIDTTAFDDLIRWLDPNPELGGSKYEVIRRKLITQFKVKGCAFADDLADLTFDRVARKLPGIKPYYRGDPARYFFGVAKRVAMEYCRNVSAGNLSPAPIADERPEDLLQQLDRALGNLRDEDRDLILKYYGENGRRKIANRKSISKELGLDPNTLRMRVYQIKAQLRDYLAENGVPEITNAKSKARKSEPGTPNAPRSNSRAECSLLMA